MTVRKSVFWAGLVMLVVIGLAAIMTRGMGFSARATPGRTEEALARAARRWATPVGVRRAVNPVAESTEALEAGLKHWADFCATCHGNDGSGDTAIGRNLYPPAPDMRGPATQSMTDGELFYVIERGIPFTGMPARSTGTADGERASWDLVRFIRHLPTLSESELRAMEALNPRSPAEAQQQSEIDDFLSGGKKIIR